MSEGHPEFNKALAQKAAEDWDKMRKQLRAGEVCPLWEGTGGTKWQPLLVEIHGEGAVFNFEGKTAPGVAEEGDQRLFHLQGGVITDGKVQLFGPTFLGTEPPPFDFTREYTVEEIPTVDLRLSELRGANVLRQLQILDTEEKASHDSVLFRATEFAGESGELCNLVKKLEREKYGWGGSTATSREVEDELADVQITLDLLAWKLRVNLSEATVRKFNADSEKRGLSARLEGINVPD